MRLGVLGGTFNPIHNGHLAVADAARRAHRLDRVLFVPSARPPHKQRNLAPAGDRLAMVQLAVAGRDGFEASAIELERPGVSYTVDTLEELKRRHPDAELYFIIGDDSIAELPGWRHSARILDLARVVAVSRPGIIAGYRQEDFPGVPAAVLARLESDRVAMPPRPEESRRLREAVARGESIRDAVPGGVADHIDRRGLYRAG